MTEVRVLWPFEVDWSSSYRVTYSFKTDILVVRAGAEQRRAQRQTPRKSIESALLLTAPQLRAFNRLLDSAQNELVVMPEVTRKAHLAAAFDGDTATIVGAPPVWVSAGAEVIIRTPQRRALARIVGLVGSAVTFSEDVGAWPASAVLHPALTGTLPPDLKAPRLTNGVAQATIRFDVDPGSETYAPGAPTSTMGALEVFGAQPNWSQALDASHLWPIETLDYGAGRVARYRPVDFPTRMVSGAYLARDAAAAEALVDVFVRMKGRRGSFLRSTLEHDIPLAAPLSAAGTTLLSSGNDIFDTYAEHPVFAAVEIHLTDGSRLRRAVSGMSLVGADTAITTVGAWGRNIAIDDVLEASWLTRSRFSSDDLTVEWLTDEVAQLQLTTQTLPMADGPNYLDLRVTPQGDDRTTMAGDDRLVLTFSGDET